MIVSEVPPGLVLVEKRIIDCEHAVTQNRPIIDLFDLGRPRASSPIRPHDPTPQPVPVVLMKQRSIFRYSFAGARADICRVNALRINHPFLEMVTLSF